MGRAYREVPVLPMEQLGLDLKQVFGDPIEELARYGARLVLASYLEAEVSEHLKASWHERSPERKGYRNGVRGRRISSSVGTIEVPYPKTRESQEPFRSRVLRAWQRRSQVVLEVLPPLYVEGLSTRDYERALEPLWEPAGLSRSSVSRANEQLKEGFQEWRRRDLTGEQVLFLFLDGYYAGVRQGTTEKEALLVAHGLNRSGKRVFLGIGLGVHESTESWKLALDDLVARGLPAPLLVISDGNPGLMAAVKKTWPAVPRQRCILHRMRNILERIPKTERKRIRKALTRIFYAPSEPEALEEARRFVRAQSETYPSACEVLVTDLADCLTFFRFPQPYWKRLRTSNPLERQFREVRRRTRVIGRFPNELAALSLVWAVLEEERLKWRGIRVSEERAARIFEAHRSLLDVPISTEDLEEILAA